MRKEEYVFKEERRIKGLKTRFSYVFSVNKTTIEKLIDISIGITKNPGDGTMSKTTELNYPTKRQVK